LGGEAQPHRLEGRSLSPLLRGNGGAPVEWRDAAIAEADYAWRAARWTLDRGPADSRAFMVRTDRWKYIHYEGFAPQLFDLDEDPGELNDLGACPDHAERRAELHDRLFAWLRQRRLRTTMTDDEVANRTDKSVQRGFLIGVW
jgi:arylsulfatase A-like enzyme